jgi:sugar lactone lactonase YvrE
MGLTIGPDGNLYVAQQSGTRIGRYSTAGQAIGATFGTARPYTGIALGPDNALYTNGAENNYTMGVSERFIPQTGAGAGNGRESGNSASFIAQFPISYFEGMAFGPDGNLYVAAHSAGAVVVYQGPGGASPGALLTTLTGTAQPDGIAFGPDGKLYVAEQNANRISRWNGSSFSAFASDHLSTPVGVSFGPDGDLYVANYNGGNIAHFQGPAGAIPGKFVSLLSSSVGNPSYLAVVPEPTSAGFIAAAGIIGLLVRRR